MRIPERDQAIPLTQQECAAVLELALRPTYLLDHSTDCEGNTELMLANASLWSQAARITDAGQKAQLQRELWPLMAGLLEEAIPEAAWDLECLTRNRNLWREGDARHGFPGLDVEQTEARYGRYITSEGRLLSALKGIQAKLEACRDDSLRGGGP